MAADSVTPPEGYQVIDHTNLPEGFTLIQPPGVVESMGRGALNNFPLAQQAAAALMPGQEYSPALQQLNEKAAFAKEASPISYGIGAAGGSLAPLAIPGVGEALGAEGMGTRALASGALGAAQAIGNTDLEQHPEEAAKQAVEGGLTGGALGAIIPGTQKAEEGLTKYANRKTVESMGLPSGVLNIPKEEVEQKGANYAELGLHKGTLDQKITKTQQYLDHYGQIIHSMGDAAPAVEDVSQYTEPLLEKANSYSKMSNREGRALARDYMAGAQDIHSLGLPEVEEAEPKPLNLLGPNGKPLPEPIIEPKTEPITFDKLADLKTKYGNLAFDANHEVKNHAAADVYGQIKQAMTDIISGSPEEYQDAMSKYSDLLDLNKALGNMRGKANAGGVPAKAFGMLGKMGAMVTGGNVPLTAGAAAAIAPTHPFMGLSLATSIMNNPGAMSTAARGISKGLPYAANAVRMGGVDAMIHDFVNNQQSYGKYAAPLNQAIQSGGKQGFAATSFVMRQQHPELNTIMMKSLDMTGNDNETQR